MVHILFGTFAISAAIVAVGLYVDRGNASAALWAGVAALFALAATLRGIREYKR